MGDERLLETQMFRDKRFSFLLIVKEITKEITRLLQLQYTLSLLAIVLTPIAPTTCNNVEVGDHRII